MSDARDSDDKVRTACNPEGRLRQLERIRERDSMRHLPNFDPERVRRQESLEIRTSPKGYERRHRDEGLDACTEAELRAAKRRLARRSRG